MIKEVSMNVMKNDFNLFINRMDLSSFPRDEYKKWDRKQKACFNLTFKGDEKPDCKIFIKNIRTDKETGKKKCIVVLESKRKIFKYWNVNLDEIDHWITKSIGGGENK